MIITIDGPAGAGKSSAAKSLAKRLGFQFLDTGAMYRAVAWVALVSQTDTTDTDAIAKLAANLTIEFDGAAVRVDGKDVTAEIRSPEVTRLVSDVADNADVREHLVMLQREIASSGDFVCEGRDQGTVVFPEAECKIFLTATSAERAKRRFKQILADGNDAEFEVILLDQENRDQRDSDRPIGRLLMAKDAIELNSDGLSLEQVVDKIEQVFRTKITSC